MAVNAYNVQVCLWKILKLSSKTCVTFLIKYPFISFALLCLFLLYMSLPSVFWFLIYSFPFIVFITIILRIFFSLGNGNNKKEENKDGLSAKKIRSAENGKSLMHAQSVRRRRAKNIESEDGNTQLNVDEKIAVFSTSFNHEMVDKSALVEETPREIREVEVDSSLINTTNKCEVAKKINDSTGNGIESLERSEDDVGGKNGNKDDKKSVIDVGISEIERTKRLESMIARRRARKLLSLQVRRTLMNMDRSDYTTAQLSSLVIPKNDNTLSPTNNGGQFSPVPGSAPSVMMPMRNPFDLPYDAYEEKPDLTGDSFHQEFALGTTKDTMFCRTGEIKQDLLRDFGFRQRGFSQGYQFSKQGHQFGRQKSCTCMEFTKIKEPELEPEPEPEPESFQVAEAKSISDSADDHIKEVIQVHENENYPQENFGQVEGEPILVDDSSPKSSSSSSSEENERFFKIDKGAILKSLSSLARRNDMEVKENNDQTGDHLNYETSLSENNRLEDNFYYAAKTVKHHTPSFSIASDMQVEVSEVSSPRTIDENISSRDEDVSTYGGDMEKEINWGSEDLWELSSHLLGAGVDGNESSSIEANEASEQDILEVGLSRINKHEDTPVIQPMPETQEMVNMSELVENLRNLESVQHSEGGQPPAEVNVSPVTMDPDDPREFSLMENVVVEQIPAIPSSSLSPKSVLQPTFSLSHSSLSNFDQDIEEVQQFVTHAGEVRSPSPSRNSTLVMENSTALPYTGRDIEMLQESSEDSRISTREDDDTESVTKVEAHENGVKAQEIDCHQAPSVPLKPTENNGGEASSKYLEAQDPTSFTEHINHVNSSYPSPSTQEELTEHQQKFTEEIVSHNNCINSRSYEDQREDSMSGNNPGHTLTSNNPNDPIEDTNSISSNHTEKRKDED